MRPSGVGVIKALGVLKLSRGSGSSRWWCDGGSVSLSLPSGRVQVFAGGSGGVCRDDVIKALNVIKLSADSGGNNVVISNSWVYAAIG